MATLTTYPWGTVLRTREEDKPATWEHAINLVMDCIDTMTTSEWDNLPTYEPTGIGRHINTLVDTGLNQRTSPKYNFTSRNRDRR